jgi:hypothetical protein
LETTSVNWGKIAFIVILSYFLLGPLAVHDKRFALLYKYHYGEWQASKQASKQASED